MEDDLGNITKRIAADMRKSENMTLHVVADLNDLITDGLQEIVDRYRKNQKAGKRVPEPSELLFGYLVYTLAQFENLDEQFRKKDAKTNTSIDLILAIATGGARRILGLYMAKEGINDKYRAIVEKTLGIFATRQ